MNSKTAFAVLVAAKDPNFRTVLSPPTPAKSDNPLSDTHLMRTSSQIQNTNISLNDQN